MAKFVTIWNTDRVFPPEENSGISDVVPDASLSVQQILERFRRGTLSLDEITNKGFYDDDDYPDVDPTLFDNIDDINDVNELRNRLSNIQQQLYGEIQESARYHQQNTPVADGDPQPNQQTPPD